MSDIEQRVKKIVAEQLGVSAASVNKAVSRHRNPGMRDRRK